jgi:hypothetical protein
MVNTKKLPQGMIYPQITQAPISTYRDFLNFFRGGHTIDDNLGATFYEGTAETEIAILDCIGFIRHFLPLFNRVWNSFVESYQRLVLALRQTR